MRVLLSGEGPTDLGSCTNALGVCEGIDFRMGPMTVLLAQMAEPKLGYDLLDTPDSLHSISETALCAYAKALPSRLQAARGKKKGVETGYFYANARALGNVAQQLEKKTGEPVLTVLFRDNDGTRSMVTSVWADKCKSIEDGFLRSGFETGIAMLPNPKSEVWLLCGATPGSSSCAALENISGNDDSPNSAKSRLDAALDGRTSGDELAHWLREHPLDVARASSMPSFKAFKDALDISLDCLLH
jgi:hypothetical protein